MSAPGSSAPDGRAPLPPSSPLSPLSIVEIYKRSLKPQDLRFNNWVCRPPAAVLVYLLRGTPVTPNQVTFASLFVALLGYAALLGCPGFVGLAVGALALHFAFILDCTDGQLARIKNASSPVGSYLDFLMDEIKAVALIAAVAGRLAIDRVAVPGAAALGSDEPRLLWLAIGLAGVVIAASGISVTTFMRRPEYFEAVTGQRAERVPGFTALKPAAAPAPSGIRALILMPVRALEWVGKLVLHYPAWFYIPALLGRLEWFLLPYLAAHTLYLGRSGLIVLVKLGRPLRKPPAAATGLLIAVGLGALLAGRALALPAARAESPPAARPGLGAAPLLEAKLRDLDDKNQSLRELRGRVLVVLHQDKDSSDENRSLKDRLGQLVQAYPQRLTLIALADVGGYDFWPARKYVKEALQPLRALGGALVLCDWQGAIRKQYGLRKAQSAIFIVAPDGELRYLQRGVATSEQAAEVLELTTQLAAPSAATATATAPKSAEN